MYIYLKHVAQTTDDDQSREDGSGENRSRIHIISIAAGKSYY